MTEGTGRDWGRSRRRAVSRGDHAELTPPQNLPVVIGIVLVASFFVVAVNIIVDALYAVLDPRVRVS